MLCALKRIPLMHCSYSLLHHFFHSCFSLENDVYLRNCIKFILVKTYIHMYVFNFFYINPFNICGEFCYFWFILLNKREILKYSLVEAHFSHVGKFSL